MTLQVSRHPCFDEAARHRFARIHLPVAPACNIQCNFCRREYDCANESRPGVTSALLSPRQAIGYLHAAVEKDPRISVVGIAGPGDPFATPDETLETLRLVRESYPEIILCVASNGLAVAPHADELAALGVSHVTLTVNAVDPDIGARVYSWVRDHKRIYRGRDAAQLLWDRQREAIIGLKQLGLTVKINAIIIPGVNDDHVVAVAAEVASLGADIANCVPLLPVANTPFEAVVPASHDAVAALRAEVARHLPIMTHCTRCRADAVGLLGEPAAPEIEQSLVEAAAGALDPDQERPYVAVATLEGVLVNQHLGEAEQFAVFAPDEQEGFRCVESRSAPPRGGGARRWDALAEILHDCRTLLVADAGKSPCLALAAHGIRVVMMEGLIEDGLSRVYRGLPIRSPARRHRCGSGCAGDGSGCS